MFNLTHKAKSMRAFLAYFALVSGVLGIVFVLFYPSILQRAMQYKYDDFGLEVDARMKVARTMPSYAGAILSAFSIGTGIGLLRKRDRARKSWLILCVLWLELSVFAGVQPSTNIWEALAPIGFRLLILIVSFKVFCRDDIRREFLKAEIPNEPLGSSGM